MIFNNTHLLLHPYFHLDANLSQNFDSELCKFPRSNFPTPGLSCDLSFSSLLREYLDSFTAFLLFLPEPIPLFLERIIIIVGSKNGSTGSNMMQRNDDERRNDLNHRTRTNSFSKQNDVNGEAIKLHWLIASTGMLWEFSQRNYVDGGEEVKKFYDAKYIQFEIQTIFRTFVGIIIVIIWLLLMLPARLRSMMAIKSVVTQNTETTPSK